jgi:hypothetical protein
VGNRRVEKVSYDSRLSQRKRVTYDVHPRAVLVAELPQAQDVGREAAAAAGPELPESESCCSLEIELIAAARVDLSKANGDYAGLAELAVLLQAVFESSEVEREVARAEVDDVAPTDAGDGRRLDELRRVSNWLGSVCQSPTSSWATIGGGKMHRSVHACAQDLDLRAAGREAVLGDDPAGGHRLGPLEKQRIARTGEAADVGGRRSGRQRPASKDVFRKVEELEREFERAGLERGRQRLGRQVDLDVGIVRCDEQVGEQRGLCHTPSHKAVVLPGCGSGGAAGGRDGRWSDKAAAARRRMRGERQPKEPGRRRGRATEEVCQERFRRTCGPAWPIASPPTTSSSRWRVVRSVPQPSSGSSVASAAKAASTSPRAGRVGSSASEVARA